MADVLVVAVYEDEQTAWDAVVTAANVAAQGQAGLHDACLVVRAPDGKVHLRETSDIGTTKAGWYGGAWGLLGGAVIGFPIAVAAAAAGVGMYMARRRDVGVTDEFERAVAERLEPGRSAAVVLVEETFAGRIAAAAEAGGAWTKTVTLKDAESITQTQ
jgi:uncharacterized membrane protein